MPRLVKRSFPDTIGKPFQDVSDDNLRVVEYAMIGYGVDRFVGVSKDKNNIMKWLGFSLIALSYENFLGMYGADGQEKPCPNHPTKA